MPGTGDVETTQQSPVCQGTEETRKSSVLRILELYEEAAHLMMEGTALVPMD